MQNNTKLKEFVEIMEEIDSAIVTNPKCRSKYIEFLDKEIDKLNDELAQDNIPRKQLNPVEFFAKRGLKYLEFDKDGNLVQFWTQGRARDFRR